MTTRYSKSGQGRPWTIKELEAIPTDWKGDTLADGGGLIGEIRASSQGNVSVRFKYGFKWEGKKTWFQCGTWPTNGLSEIRAARDDARDKVKAGVNPNTDKQAARIEAQAAREAVIAQAAAEAAERKTVQDLFDAWIADGVARKDGNAELKRSFAKDVLPSIGAIELRNLTEQHIRAVIKAMIERGVTRLADATFNNIVQMLHWGEKRQPWRGLMVNGNPADLVEIGKLLPSDYEEERDRVLSPAELRELAGMFDHLRESYDAAPTGTKYDAVRPMKRETELALWICLGTLCRIGELLQAEWKHVDLQAGTWFIPKANVKGRGKKKQDHHVFLSNFTKRQFAELQERTGHSPWLFPASNKPDVQTHVCLKSVSKQVGDRQERFKNRSGPLARRRHDNTLVLADGVNGEWTPHDMRRTGATMMQQLGVSLDIIDRCQNHVLGGSRVRRHYLHHDYKDEKSAAWNKLGERLEAIMAGGAEILQLSHKRA